MLLQEPVRRLFPRVFCSRSNENGGIETAMKVVEADRCLICSTVVAKKEKLYNFGKSSIDSCEIIKSALLKRECEKLLS